MRTVMDAPERRNEILDAAQKLFAAKGYDATSTADLLNELGIARGTLYYHFRSKEDILDAVIRRMSETLTRKAAQIAARREIPVLQRLTMTIQALNVDSPEGAAVMVAVHKPQNALMHQKMQENLLSEVTPLVASLIREGMDLGICSTPYPEEVAEMTLFYATSAFDDLTGHTGEQRERRIRAFTFNLERMLGMEEGSLLQTVLPMFQKNT